MAHNSPVAFLRICNAVLLILLFFLFSKPAHSLVTSNCSMSQANYTTNDRFHQNLKFVLNNLSVVANTTNRGFYSFKSGTELDTDAVFGLYLCRGDITPTECSLCITDARQEIVDECPNKKEVILWSRDECTLRYANRNIFSKEEEEPSHALWSAFSHKPDPNTPPPPTRPFNVSEVIFNLINETAFGNYLSKIVPPFFSTRRTISQGDGRIRFSTLLPSVLLILFQFCVTSA